jgi:hypothetical protein
MDIRFGAVHTAYRFKENPPGSNSFEAAQIYEAQQAIENLKKKVKEEEKPSQIHAVEIMRIDTPGMPADEPFVVVLVTDKDADEFVITAHLDGAAKAKLDLYKKATSADFQAAQADVLVAKKTRAAQLDAEADAILTDLKGRLDEVSDWRDVDLLAPRGGSTVGNDVKLTIGDTTYSLRDVYAYEHEALPPGVKHGQFLIKETPEGKTVYPMTLDTYKKYYRTLHLASMPTLSARSVGNVLANRDKLSHFMVTNGKDVMYLRFRADNRVYNLERRVSDKGDGKVAHILREEQLVSEEELRAQHQVHILNTLKWNAEAKPGQEMEIKDFETFKIYQKDNNARTIAADLTPEQFDEVMAVLKDPVAAYMQAELGLGPNLDVKAPLVAAAQDMLDGKDAYAKTDDDSLGETRRLELSPREGLTHEFMIRNDKLDGLRHGFNARQKGEYNHSLPITEPAMIAVMEAMFVLAQTRKQRKAVEYELSPESENFSRQISEIFGKPYVADLAKKQQNEQELQRLKEQETSLKADLLKRLTELQTG